MDLGNFGDAKLLGCNDDMNMSTIAFVWSGSSESAYLRCSFDVSV
jgi:hypothetical protein